MKFPRRRVRATFLLRVVILAGVVGAFTTVFLLGHVIGGTLWFMVFLVLFWFLAIELDLLPLLIEHVLARRAGASEEPVESIWFVDLDVEATRHRHESERSTRKNPTIR